MAALRDEALKSKKPFDYDREVEGIRALDRYTLQFKLDEPRPRFLHLLALGDLYGAVAREVVEAYGDEILRNRSAPVRFVSPNGGGHRGSCSSATRRIAKCLYDAEPNADDAEGQALLQRFRGRRLPMIDRVEISIIEEQQPRWLSFLNKQQDLMERIANEFINLAAPNGKLAPNLQRQNMQLYRVLAVGSDDVRLQHGPSGDRRLHTRKSRVAPCDQSCDQHAAGNPAGAQEPSDSGAVADDAQHHRLRRQNFAVKTANTILPRAKALLDMYGYVDRDGDGWREQPNGQPLTLEVVDRTQPGQPPAC